ncbi:hypothetical protein CDD81_3790 [Ophiocordyceps australis]|uniref:RING-type domain-containing protein n=1 Tax=Ophiocordyceps australis TaxID=1399860 RepID=A0A2C5YBD8_9HYPO|nr:hypothetical protein CDD81_3790 [Ophiocordyceps australis]
MTVCGHQYCEECTAIWFQTHHMCAPSSGLNLVQASHVLLCEPLLNTPLELQAIERVNRIGQRIETTVWLFVLASFVEGSVHDLSARRRLEHASACTPEEEQEKQQQQQQPSLSSSSSAMLLDTATSEQLQQAYLMSHNKEAGDDLWELLFGHVAREPKLPRPTRRLKSVAAWMISFYQRNVALPSVILSYLCMYV